MADETKAKAAGSTNTDGDAIDPAGQSAAATAVKDPEAVLAKNAELIRELKQQKAKLRQFEEAEAAREEAKKKDEGKFAELLSDRDQALQKRDTIIKRKEVALLMQRHGLQDPDYADILLQRVEFDDEFNPTNADTIFDSLKKDKPFLFGGSAAKAPALKTDTAKAVQVKPGHVFTRAEIRRLMETPEGRAIHRENKVEIDRQWAAGLIK